MRADFQVVVIGSGFGGSLVAMMARRLGFSTALIERGRHPRFAIGESSTPLANLLLEEIADEYDLAFLRPLCKWGSWQEKNPHLACGLKRGFTFYYHQLGRPFQPDAARRCQLMVGASPTDKVADTHWYRPDFDHYLARQAQLLGVDYLDETELESAREETDRMRLTGKHRGQPLNLTAEFIIDASGPRGFLHRAFGLPEKTLEGFPVTQALFSHFAGVCPLPECFTGGDPPYPPERAAVHHVFDGGWIWVLRFNNGLASAGVAATAPLAERFQFRSGEAAWRRLLRKLPSLAETFEPAQAVTPFVWQPRVAFQSAVVAGRRWALLPSAAGVIDPLLSTGFPLTLLGVQRLGRILKTHGQPRFQADLDDYARLTTLELEATARLVKALYATMDRFDAFRELSLLYFAAASFSEAARRLGKSHLAPDFLFCRHPVFAPQFRQLCESGSRNLKKRVRQAIEPIDVAGLTDRSRHPWYPALASDLFANAAKLHASPREIALMLERCGLTTKNVRTMDRSQRRKQ
jgi:tetracycline 7-halogenase / FADH2 O2-dependent halogenase